MGRRLARLARSAQVLVVTHLPQVAAFADRHVVVEKSSDGTVTTSGLTVLDDGERVRELSRMLAGMEDSDTALAHARELLDVGPAPAPAAEATAPSATPPRCGPRSGRYAVSRCSGHEIARRQASTPPCPGSPAPPRSTGGPAACCPGWVAATSP